jgi:phenylalanyl-tRNA synthetase beta chain
MDIGEGVAGQADLMEEIARIYGYDRIPETRLADALPPQVGNPPLEREEFLRDRLVSLGLQEVVTYRMTSSERERRRFPRDIPADQTDQKPYMMLANPITIDRNVLRHSLMASVLEVVERNARIQERLALFEIGPVFMVSEAEELPDELPRLAIVMTGPRTLPAWQGADATPMDFYDLKGVVDAMVEDLHLGEVRYEPFHHPSFHPGKCARVSCLDEHGSVIKQLGVIGELHPLVRKNYDLPASGEATPILAAEFDLEAILALLPERFGILPVPTFPPVLEDLAVVVAESLPAERVEEVIQQAGGKTLIDIRLFDMYRGEQVGPGKKSLAYSLTYQDAERTLTDEEVAKIRQRIIRNLEQELNARLRS